MSMTSNIRLCLDLTIAFNWHTSIGSQYSELSLSLVITENLAQDMR
jgi:hypothetical protein